MLFDNFTRFSSKNIRQRVAVRTLVIKRYQVSISPIFNRSFRQLLVHFKVIEDPGAAQHMGDQEYNSLHAG